jgi:hypothetical protein
VTRQEALDKAAEHLQEAESAFGDTSLSKHLSLAQLFMGYAHEMNNPDFSFPVSSDSHES